MISVVSVVTHFSALAVVSLSKGKEEKEDN
jgi:hypothetical protein